MLHAHAYARLGGAFASLIAATVAVGWLASVDVLVRFLPGHESMRPASAVAMFCAGAALWLRAHAEPALRRWGWVFAGVAGLIGVELALEHAELLTRGFHDLLTRGKELEALSHRSTTAGILAASLALALSAVRRPWAQRGFDALVLFLLALGMLCILARLYGWDFRGSSLPSGLTFLSVGAGLPFLRSERGIAAAVLDAGPSGVVLRRLVPPAVIVPAGLGFLEDLLRASPRLARLGSAPFVLGNITLLLVLITLSVRVVRVVNQRWEAVQRALGARDASYTALLREREARYRLLADSAPQIVWVATSNGAIEYLSAEWTRFVGKTSLEAIGWQWKAMIHPADLSDTLQIWGRCVESGEPYEHEYRLRRHDGCYRWFLSRAVPIRNERGVITKWYGADTDIHELREAREALRLSEARFRVTLQNRQFLVWMQDRDLRYTWIYNPVPGFEAERSLGHHDLELLERREEALELTERKRKVLESGQPFAGEMALTVAGERRHYELFLHPVFDPKRQVEGIAGAAYDITERLRAEDAQRRSQHLESVGMLAAGVAHDFNNLLTVVMGNASIARSSLRPEGLPRVAGMLDNVIEAGESAALLTRQLLAYAGKGRLVVGLVQLGELLTGLTSLLRPNIPPAIELTFEIEPGLPSIDADASQIQQLMTNLIMNGVEAIGEAAGRVNVSVRSVFRDDSSTNEAWFAEHAAGRYVLVEVRDSGHGMPTATLERAFDPFFSTKLLGRGLGLSAAQGIARAHGGSIHAASEENQGTCMRVVFPAARAAAERPHAGPNTALRPTLAAVDAEGRGVLFVDDEEHVRALAEFALGDAGFRVLLAKHGGEALELVRAHPGEIDAIVLDMTMPVLNGVETARRLREMQVLVPIIASSGYSESETRLSFGDTALDVLHKPYRPEELVRKVKAVLASQSQAKRVSG